MVTVGVRPEDLDISSTGEGLPVQVDVVEELGADAYIYGTTDVGQKVDIDDPDLRGEDKGTGGDNIIARTDGRKPPTRGETVHLVPSGSGHVHFFDMTTGLRLEA